MDKLYIGDNGRVTCLLHAGATAQATGRDLSGQRLMPLDDETKAELSRMIGGGPVCCETCRARAKRAA